MNVPQIRVVQRSLQFITIPRRQAELKPLIDDAPLQHLAQIQLHVDICHPQNKVKFQGVGIRKSAPLGLQQ